MQIIEQLPNYPITFFIIISRPECLLKCHLLNTFLCLFKYYVLSNGTRFVCAIKTIWTFCNNVTKRTRTVS